MTLPMQRIDPQSRRGRSLARELGASWSPERTPDPTPAERKAVIANLPSRWMDVKWIAQRANIPRRRCEFVLVQLLGREAQRFTSPGGNLYKATSGGIEPDRDARRSQYLLGKIRGEL